jgi:Lipid A 3-O-deacylase (PagL)
MSALRGCWFSPLSVVLLLFGFGAAPAVAQTPGSSSPSPQQKGPVIDPTPLFDVGAQEWMATAGNAWGVVMFHSVGGHRYATQTLSWGRVLTKPHFSGRLRGRFEWAFEMTPVYGQYEPHRLYGFGLSPLVWRWNFEPRGRYAPYGELAGGALWTTGPVPDRTTGANFMAHAGVGLRVFMRSHQALVVGYQLHHISNGNRLDRNPGVNAHNLHIGWAYFKRPTPPRPPTSDSETQDGK